MPTSQVCDQEYDIKNVIDFLVVQLEVLRPWFFSRGPNFVQQFIYSYIYYSLNLYIYFTLTQLQLWMFSSSSNKAPSFFKLSSQKMQLRPIISPFAVLSLIHLVSLNFCKETWPMTAWAAASFALQFHFLLSSGIIPYAEYSKNSIQKLCTFKKVFKEYIIMYTGAELGFPREC